MLHGFLKVTILKKESYRAFPHGIHRYCILLDNKYTMHIK